ncbi:MAG: cysteine--tRNA ligase [Gemmatimonadaceae bacterium]
MPELHLYNTLSRRIEKFAPADGHTVRIYSCGPTVYNPAHLGNFRTFLFEDLLRRVIRLQRWDVVQVMNITDVDDKIITRAAQQGKSISEITEPMEEVFHRDREFLRMQRAEHYPRATDHIPEMIALVEALMERSLAYRADDGSIYFAIARFPGYGKLSRLDTRDIKAGARVAADDYNKEDVRDFALWKAAKPEDEEAGAVWNSPWGRGRPGWHLECSAMARRYLGDTLDIHCGGVDLIFPHHEDEIAQSEGATGVAFSRFWCHGEFLLTEGAKMAKRVGNVASVEALREQGVSAAAIRHFVFSTHYRKQLNLTDESIEASTSAVRRVREFADRLANASVGTPELAKAAAQLEDEARAAFLDDLNAPAAVGALFTFIRRANAELDRTVGRESDGDVIARARAGLELVNGVLDIIPEVVASSAEGITTASAKLGSTPAHPDGSDLVAWVNERIAARVAARARGDFVVADGIRAELLGRGVSIEDSPAGTRWKLIR